MSNRTVKVTTEDGNSLEAVEFGHWRGFAKCRLNGGRCIGVYTGNDGLLLGPAKDGVAVDRLIEDFYAGDGAVACSAKWADEQ